MPSALWAALPESVRFLHPASTASSALPRTIRPHETGASLAPYTSPGRRGIRLFLIRTVQSEDALPTGVAAMHVRRRRVDVLSQRLGYSHVNHFTRAFWEEVRLSAGEPAARQEVGRRVIAGRQ